MTGVCSQNDNDGSMHKVAIITGSTKEYFEFLDELLLNFDEMSIFDEYDVYVFDIDFQSDQIRRIRRYPVVVRQLDRLPLEISHPAQERRHMVETIRPVIRDVFPGHEAYIHFDVDVWLQDRSAVDDLAAAASAKQLVLVAEDPAIYGSAIARAWRKKHIQFYGEATAAQMTGRTNWNGGVFALHVDSPAWAVWASEYKSVVERSGEWWGGSQSVFTYLDMIGALAIRSLPPTYNWLIANAPPLWNNVSKHFVAPTPPHEKILVMHQNHKSKYRRFKVRCTDGRTMRTTFRYPAYLALRESTGRRGSWWPKLWGAAGEERS